MDSVGFIYDTGSANILYQVLGLEATGAVFVCLSNSSIALTPADPSSDTYSSPADSGYSPLYVPSLAPPVVSGSGGATVTFSGGSAPIYDFSGDGHDTIYGVWIGGSIGSAEPPLWGLVISPPYVVPQGSPSTLTIDPLLLTLGSCTSPPPPPPPASAPYITAVTPEGLQGDQSGLVLGYYFTIQGAALVVTQLGLYCVAGNTQPAYVGIYTPGGSVLALVEIFVSGLGTGWNYVALGTPITLAIGTEYVCGMYYQTPDSYYGQGSAITSTADAVLGTAAFVTGTAGVPSGAFSPTGAAGEGWLANYQYYV